jgi:hypothetical protein
MTIDGEMTMSDNDRIAALEEQLAILAARVTVQEDEQAVRKLQHLYGYLIGGIYRGKAGAARLYITRFQTNFTHGNNGPVDGFLLDHPQHQDIVDIQPDGVTALARFRCVMQAGRHKDYGGPRQWFEGGLYENTYRKVDGVWRIHILNYVPQWHADFETGWAHTRPNYVPFLNTTYPEDPTGPDELKADVWLWPTHKVVPFHNVHPVTGAPIRAERWQGDIDRENAAK